MQTSFAGTRSAGGWAELPAEYAIPETAPSLEEARAYCERLAKRHYENFSVATWFLPAKLRPHFYSIYAYCRISDDLGDEVGELDRDRPVQPHPDAEVLAHGFGRAGPEGDAGRVARDEVDHPEEERHGAPHDEDAEAEPPEDVQGHREAPWSVGAGAGRAGLRRPPGGRGAAPGDARVDGGAQHRRHDGSRDARPSATGYNPAMVTP